MTPSTPWIGRILKDTYRIDQPIGEGGTGLVFAGFHTRLKIVIAVKILKQNAGQVAFARFRKEAEITARLRHPNIVQILDYDVSSDGHAYIVTEWLEGETLAAFMKRSGAVPAQQAVAILRPVGEAVAAAHAAGVVHRDLKPANLFLSKAPGPTDEPLVKVLDFGIAKLLDTDPVRTEQGTTVGTPRYMSPEQIKVDAGDEVGPPSDQFSLGSIAYELVAGQPAFPGSAHAAMLAVLEGKPRPLPSQVPSAYRRAVRRAMAVRIDDRFPSIGEFIGALQEACDEPPPPQWPRGLLVGGAALLGLLCTLVILLSGRTGGQPRDVPRGGGAVTMPQPVVTPLSTVSGEPAHGDTPALPGTTGAPGSADATSQKEPSRMVVRPRIAPQGAVLRVDGKPVRPGALELPVGVAVHLRLDAPPGRRLCCPSKELRYVAGEGHKPPVLELQCDRNCPIR